MARDPRTAKDVRLRPFRAAAYCLHLLLIFIFTGLVIVSVVRSVVAMTPARRTSTASPLSPRECADRAQQFFSELESRRLELTAKAHVRRADADWSHFRVGWLERLRDAEARCGVEDPARSSLKRAFASLERLMDLYTTHAVQFAGEVGGTVDRFRQAVDAVRRGAGSAGG